MIIKVKNRDGIVVEVPILEPETYSNGRGLMRLNSKFKGILENSSSYNEALFGIYEYLIDEIYSKEPSYKELNIDWFGVNIPYLEIAGNQYKVIDEVFLGVIPEEKKTKGTLK